ncbi:hypothetical protein C8A03DRAFT_15694 [Achaetomium macrosporum]|uniref:Uncharacterized protein n=1 Tax=Achaetomium macrosporum TaxID=79813 RepID=A0AAN7HAL1_9PEZI|nr:hypothetical protein C8A03DRAFT_15694 [Achaetomium macrosporum]
MRGIRNLRHLAVAAAALLRPALALPQGGIIITESAAPIAWVSVGPTGSATTITPAVITTQGQRTTLATAPPSLAATATYVLSPLGHASTYTGLAPVASATGTGGSIAGVFPACDDNSRVGPVEPFCLPLPGSELHPGTTYYVTWSPTYFPTNQTVSLQVIYNSSSSSSPAANKIGATSPPVPAAQGFFFWTVPPDFLSSRGNPARYPVTFVLAYNDTSTPRIGNDLNEVVGPTVYITPGSGSISPGAGGGGSSTHAAAIAVPVVIAAVLALLAAFSAVSWRRTGHVPLIGGLAAQMKKRRGASGYGVRQSRSERVGSSYGAGAVWAGNRGGGDSKSETNVDIQLTDRDSWSPTAGGGGATGGRNVFREEVERQARLG